MVEVGSTITDLPVGTLVTAEEIQWCGRCDSCRRGLVNHCTDLEELGFTTPGAMAQYVAVRARYCWSLTELAARLGDDRTALTLGALVEPCGVSYHAMFNRLAAPRPGATVAVFGAGPIGLTATALAATAGAATVIALDISPSRLERAREMGATEVLNPTGLDLNEVLLEATCGRGVDLVVEAAGAPEHTLSPLTDGLAVGATIVHIGRSEHPTALPLEHYQTRRRAARRVAGPRRPRHLPEHHPATGLGAPRPATDAQCPLPFGPGRGSVQAPRVAPGRQDPP